jgi:hypothetical protein
MSKTLKLYNPKRVGKRKCGDCTGCCITPSLSAPPHKPLGERCPELRSGRKRGCGIYETRPNGCREYQCHWLFNGLLEQQHRPDKIGIIFDDGQVRQKGFWEKLGHSLALALPPLTARELRPGAFKDQSRLLKTLATELVVILVRNPADPESRLRVIGPNRRTIDAVWTAVMALAKTQEGA